MEVRQILINGIALLGAPPLLKVVRLGLERDIKRRHERRAAAIVRCHRVRLQRNPKCRSKIDTNYLVNIWNYVCEGKLREIWKKAWRQLGRIDCGSQTWCFKRKKSAERTQIVLTSYQLFKVQLGTQRDKRADHFIILCSSNTGGLTSTQWGTSYWIHWKLRWCIVLCQEKT